MLFLDSVVPVSDIRCAYHNPRLLGATQTHVCWFRVTGLTVDNLIYILVSSKQIKLNVCLLFFEGLGLVKLSNELVSF